MSYNVQQLLHCMQSGRISATAETNAALILSVAEQLEKSPQRIGTITLTVAGAVMLEETAPITSEQCDAQLRVLLGRLISGCGGDHPALLAVARANPVGLGALSSQLSSALVPFNRSAARRALARLYRRLEAADPPPTRELAPLHLDTLGRPDASAPDADGVDASHSQYLVEAPQLERAHAPVTTHRQPSTPALVEFPGIANHNRTPTVASVMRAAAQLSPSAREACTPSLGSAYVSTCFVPSELPVLHQAMGSAALRLDDEWARLEHTPVVHQVRPQPPPVASLKAGQVGPSWEPQSQTTVHPQQPPALQSFDSESGPDPDPTVLATGAPPSLAEATRAEHASAEVEREPTAHACGSTTSPAEPADASAPSASNDDDTPFEPHAWESSPPPPVYFGRFQQRRSDVDSLLVGFRSEQLPEEEVADALRRCAQQVGEAVSVCTPAPARCQVAIARPSEQGRTEL